MYWIKRLSWLLLWCGLAAGMSVAIARGERPNILSSSSNRLAAKPQAADAVLLEFYADWCGPCRDVAPAVDAMVAAGYCVERINVDQEQARAAEYGVDRIPCFVAVADGREIDRVTGGCSYERLDAMMKRRLPSVGNPQSAIQDTQSPHPAWRYEQPEGYRRAVVRIFSDDDTKSRSIGSGALVRWNGRIVVLTARHVVKGVKSIIVELCTRRTHWAKVVKVDAVWDCAVLELVGELEGVEPVDVELGNDAMQREGNRLESCGYGPDGKLACNSGSFLGYRRSTATPQGPDDWLVISGHARGGDSGGPVFNHRGRLVGVLWGTDGREVVCVQAGRVHRLLEEAVPAKSAVQQAISQRRPTPPLAGPEPNVMPQPPMVSVPPAPGCAASPGDLARQKSLGQIFGCKPIPAPSCPPVIVQSDPEVARSLDRIDAKIGALVERRQSHHDIQKTDEGEASPLVAGLCVLGAVVAGFVVYFASTAKN